LTIKWASDIIPQIRRSGEIGRRTGLKIQRPRGHAGSTPASGTIEETRLYGKTVKPFSFSQHVLIENALINLVRLCVI
jgi:hypothetical protein